jgi:hypothetical protein
MSDEAVFAEEISGGVLDVAPPEPELLIVKTLQEARRPTSEG